MLFNLKALLIEWCLAPTVAIFQLYRGVFNPRVKLVSSQAHQRFIEFHFQ